MAQPARVLIADDHRLVREALRAVLEPECEVVAEAGSSQEALEQARKVRPDVALIDIGMPGIGGLEVARKIARELPSTRIIILTQYADDEYVVGSLTQLGAHGYVVKGDAASDLLAAIRAVRAGKSYVSPTVAPALLRQIASPRRPRSSPQPQLTHREREVLKLISEGASVKEVALALGIAPKTAQLHRTNLMTKLNAHSTAELVRWAIRHKVSQLD